MYEIDPDKTHVAEEFLADPLGHHSPELQRVLWVMRGAPLEGKYALVCTKPYREWTLVRMSGERGTPPRLLRRQVYTSLKDAERAVFRLRWKAYTGRALN